MRRSARPVRSRAPHRHAQASTHPPGGKPNQRFKNRKIQFRKALSENLYFRNLDNDAGVFHYLLDAAEEVEVKEAVLAYHFLRTAARPLTAKAVDRRVGGLVHPAVGDRLRLRRR